MELESFRAVPIFLPEPQNQACRPVSPQNCPKLSLPGPAYPCCPPPPPHPSPTSARGVCRQPRSSAMRRDSACFLRQSHVRSQDLPARVSGAAVGPAKGFSLCSLNILSLSHVSHLYPEGTGAGSNDEQSRFGQDFACLRTPPWVTADRFLPSLDFLAVCFCPLLPLTPSRRCSRHWEEGISLAPSSV